MLGAILSIFELGDRAVPRVHKLRTVVKVLYAKLYGMKLGSKSAIQTDEGTLAIEDKPREEHPSLDTWGQSGQHDRLLAMDSMQHNSEVPASRTCILSHVRDADRSTVSYNMAMDFLCIQHGDGFSLHAHESTPGAAPCDIGKNMRLFTDVGCGAWRVTCSGRANKTFTWKTDPKGAWERLCNYVSAG